MENLNSVKVCHITSAHNWNDIRIFIKECSSLSEAGFSVSLVAANCENQVVNGVNIVGVQSVTKGRFGRMRKTAKAVYLRAKELNADIYHFHDPELLPYGNKLRKVGKIVIYDAHEDVPRQILSKYWINKYLRKIVSKSFERYENRIAAKLSGIVTATPFIAQRFLKINKNAIDINNFPLENELAGTAPWETKKNQICYIGGISLIRGNAELVEAMNGLSGVQLVMAGGFSNSEFENVLREKKGWSNVDFKGLVDRKAVAQIMNESKAGVVTFLPLPNHVDAQPNKMFEYMSAGIPVIASHFPLWKEIIEGNDCGICVDPENPNEIKNAVTKIFANDSEAKRMGDNGRRAVLEKYNWKAESMKLVRFYTDLLNKK